MKTRVYTLKILTQSFIEGMGDRSFTFTEYILIGELSPFICNDELIIDEKLEKVIKEKVEQDYLNAENNNLRELFVKIVDYEDFYENIVIDDLIVIMQRHYMFDPAITLEAFLEKYDIGSDIN